MTREERHRIAELDMEKKIDLIRSLGLAPTESLYAAFRFGRAYGLNEAAEIMMETPNGPKPPLESD